MADAVRTRVREAEPEVGEKYNAVYQYREDFLAHQLSTPLVIKALRPEEYELCPQGLIGWYLHQLATDTCFQDWWVFVHDIRKVSGRHKHQGGLVLFILEGRGYTTMNGVRYDWKEGDLLVLPLLPGGVEHQHFNLVEGGTSKWLAFIHVPTLDEVGSELSQTAIDPEWAAKNNVTSWKGASAATETLQNDPTRKV
jgi:mannose-6-phosphate isomerase-like protein (cupin superfamily)